MINIRHYLIVISLIIVVVSGVIILFPVSFPADLGFSKVICNPVCSYAGPQSDPVKTRFLPGELTDRYIKEEHAARVRLEWIAEILPEDRTVQNTLIQFEDLLTDYDEETLIYSLIRDVYPDKDIVAEAVALSMKREWFYSELADRSDIREAIIQEIPSDPEDAALQRTLLSGFTNATMNQTTREDLNNLTTRLSTLESEYRSNQDKGHAIPNLHLMNTILEVRHEIATTCGYSSYFDYALGSVFTNESNIPLRNTLKDYLKDQTDSLRVLSHNEAVDLLAEKITIDPKADRVYDYEIADLWERISTNLSPDVRLIHEFFPADRVIDRMNLIFGELFNLSITEQPVMSAWDSDVHVYQINDFRSGEVLAFWFLQIEKDNKQVSGRTYLIKPGRTINGVRNPAVSAVIIPATSGEGSETSFFSSEDLQILFHEYGHMLKHSLACSRYATLSGGRFESQPAREIPSHLIEHICWEPDFFCQIIGDDADKSGQTSPDLLDPMIQHHGEELTFGSGYIRAYRMFLANLDITLHSGPGPYDFSILSAALYQNITGMVDSSGGAGLLLNPSFFLSPNAGTYWQYPVDDEYISAILRIYRDAGGINQEAGSKIRARFFESEINDPIIDFSLFS
ncbi:MAG TPA: M3 family metallopeptidase [Methanospirillum sp.]|nr:M3 family metallopeptidase [Methanospirillum sp.]